MCALSAPHALAELVALSYHMQPAMTDVYLDGDHSLKNDSASLDQCKQNPKYRWQARQFLYTRHL